MITKMKKTVTWLIVLTLWAIMIHDESIAYADSWVCPNCGQECRENANFCSNCGAAKPTWNCPNCGRSGNTGNYCPNCGAAYGWHESIIVDPIAVHNCPLLMRLSTRTGPSTNYDEPGSFFNQTWQTVTVDVISKAMGNGIWWLQVEFSNGGKLYRAYTGLKRVNVDINAVLEEAVLGTGMLNTAGSVEGYYGPGMEYEVIKEEVPWSVQVTIWGAENDYLLIDFYDPSTGTQRRAWVLSKFITWY